jgi:hypothetical protein
MAWRLIEHADITYTCTELAKFVSTDICPFQNKLFLCHPVSNVTAVCLSICLSQFRCIGFTTRSVVGGAPPQPPPSTQPSTARVWRVA